MITYLIIAPLILGCPNIKLENRTIDPWNLKDMTLLEAASNRCGQLYNISPCIKEFRKRTTTDYSVICGKKLNE